MQKTTGKSFDLAARGWQRLLLASGLLIGTGFGCGDGAGYDDSETDEPGALAEGAEGELGGESVTAEATAPAIGSWCAAKPVVEKYCANCHDGNGTGGSPMALKTPADFQASSPITTGKKVHQTSTARVNDSVRPMPPKGNLSASDKAALDAWLKAGAPAGSDATCASTTPPVKNDGRVNGWNPADCDEIYEIRSHAPNSAASPYQVPPGQEIHPQVNIDAPWGSEQIQAINFKPITDNAKVLHHWILYTKGRAFLTGWAPGDNERDNLPKDVGMDMPTGKSSLTLDMHYYNKNGGKTEPDRSGLQVCALKRGHFRKNLAAVSMGLMSIGQGGVLAPRNSVNKPATGTCRVTSTQPVHIISAAPHAHQYATRMRFTVKRRNGQEIVMHDQKFVFGEQGSYPVPGGEVIVQNGDTITTTCYFTNTTNKDVRFGESSDSEMCFNFALYYPKGALTCGLGGGLLGGSSGGSSGRTGLFGGGLFGR